MQKQYSVHSLLLIISILFISCDKPEEEKDLILKGIYQTEATATVGPIQMYTRQGPVNDAQVINKFLNKECRVFFSPISYRYVDNFITNSSNESLRSYNLFTFGPNQKVIITSPSSQASPVEARITEKTNKLILLTHLDSVVIENDVNSFYGPIIKNINLYVPQGRCYPVIQSSSTFSFLCTVAQITPIQHDNGKLSLPLFSYLLQVGNPSTGYGHIGMTNIKGTINTSSLNQLRVDNTLLVQNKVVGLQKQ